MKQLAVIAPARGINKYAPNFLIDDQEWTDGHNIRFGTGYAEKSSGYKKYLNFPDAWAADTNYIAGAYVVPTTANNCVYRCTTAGVSGSTEPIWSTTTGSTVNDGIAVWTNIGVNKLSGAIMAMDSYYKYDGTSFLMAITATRAYYYHPDHNVFVDITGSTPLGGIPDFPVVTENAQNWFVFTNNVDPIKYWDGDLDHTIADLPGLDDAEGGVTSVRAKTLLYFKNFLILGNTTENGDQRPQRIRWSCLSDITKWKNVTNDISRQQAGYGDLTDDVSWVQALRPLGNYVVIYKERAIQMLSYTGDELIWQKWPAIIGTGLLATKALVDLGDEHLFIGNDNIFSFNGRDTAIAGDSIKKEYFRLQDPDKYELISSFFIEETPELWFSFSSVNSPNGYPDMAISYNTDTKAWSIKDMPMTAFGYFNRKDNPTWDAVMGSWDAAGDQWDSSINLQNAPINLCGDSNGSVYVFEGNSFNGAEIGSVLTSKLFDFGEPSKIKRLLRIQFMIRREGPFFLPVYVGATANVDEEIEWHGPYYMSLDKTAPPWVDVDISARYLCIRMGTTGADEPFRLTGYVMYYEFRGSV